MRNDNYHESVLLQESVELLTGNSSSGVFVDATYGASGHSVHILNSIDKDSKLVAFDQDSDAIVNLIQDPRLCFIQSNFRYLKQYLSYLKLDGVDGILADLGVSSYQFDESDRGFTFRSNAPLDMRMNRQYQKIKASDILNSYQVQALQSMFSDYGEVKFAKSLAEAIVRSRQLSAFESSQDLLNVIKIVTRQKAKIKEYAQVFQALRIEVNDELGALKDFLISSAEELKPGGRLVILSYHSLEDRLVKRFLNNGNFQSQASKDEFGNVLRPLKPLFKKPIEASEKEIEENSRSRSVKMRVGIKL